MKATARPYPGALFVDGTLEQDESLIPPPRSAALIKRIYGEAPAIYRKNAFNDTIRFAERGRAAITFGPGEDGWPPVNEYIHIGKSVAATKILALTVLDLSAPSHDVAHAFPSVQETAHDPLHPIAVVCRQPALAPLHVASAQDLKPIKIGFQTGEINVILSYALGSGLFKANGLDVKTAQFPAGPAMLPAHCGRRSRSGLDG